MSNTPLRTDIDLSSEPNLARVFRWLDRNGMGRGPFGRTGVPIGWYQTHQFHAWDFIKQSAENVDPALGSIWPLGGKLRVRSHGSGILRERYLEFKPDRPPFYGRHVWIVLMTCDAVFREADRRSRT